MCDGTGWNLTNLGQFPKGCKCCLLPLPASLAVTTTRQQSTSTPITLAPLHRTTDLTTMKKRTASQAGEIERPRLGPILTEAPRHIGCWIPMRHYHDDQSHSEIKKRRMGRKATFLMQGSFLQWPLYLQVPTKSKVCVSNTSISLTTHPPPPTPPHTVITDTVTLTHTLSYRICVQCIYM